MRSCPCIAFISCCCLTADNARGAIAPGPGALQSLKQLVFPLPQCCVAVLICSSLRPLGPSRWAMGGGPVSRDPEGSCSRTYVEVQA